MNHQSARLIHTAMVFGVVTIVGMFAILRQVSQPEPLSQLVWILRLIAFANVVGVVLLVRVFRTQLGPLQAVESEDAWWRVFAMPVLFIWALAEGASVLGAVFWLLTGDLLILIGVSAVSMMVLVVNRPTRLFEHSTSSSQHPTSNVER